MSPVFPVLMKSNNTSCVSVFSIDLLLLFAFTCLFKLVSVESIMCQFSVKQRAENAELTFLLLTDYSAGKVNQDRKVVSGSRVKY